jgi:uncharacterized damage-inducible protein DinB
MSNNGKTIQALARRALSGEGAHVATRDVFAGLDWKAAGTRPDNAPHSFYQLLWHMNYWQDWAIAWLEGGNPVSPRHASGSWPARADPPGRSDWIESVRRYRRGLSRLERACRGADLSSGRGGRTRGDMLQTIGAHDSYHAGQVVFLRQMLGKWPPPSGGLTW